MGNNRSDVVGELKINDSRLHISACPKAWVMAYRLEEAVSGRTVISRVRSRVPPVKT